MNPNQAARVLAVAGAYDSRLTPPSREDALARAVAWSQALRADMTPEWAERAVIAHYAEQTTTIMPAHLNAAWKSQRATQIDRDRTRALASVPEGVPMPDHVREQWHRIVAGFREEDG